MPHTPSLHLPTILSTPYHALQRTSILDRKGGPAPSRCSAEGYVYRVHYPQLVLTYRLYSEDPENPNPSKWHAIAKHVPNRTNKDCRKRWFAKMASDVVKGGWAPDEDEKLVKGIEQYGTR